MLDGRLHVAKCWCWNRVWCGITDSVSLSILASIKSFLAFFKFLVTVKDG